jgi:hypothetical protein
MNAGRVGDVSRHARPCRPKPSDGAGGDGGLRRLAAGSARHEVDVWLVDEGWQVRLFFSPEAPRASGLTYPVLSTRNVFLRHADLAANRLRRGASPCRRPER